VLTIVSLRTFILGFRLRHSISAVVLLAFFLFSGCASATTYTFSIPETSIQNALTNLIGANANQYSLYEVYVRPAVSGDGFTNDSTHRTLSSYTLAGDGSPIPTNVNGDQWDATPGATAPGDSPNLSIHFFFDNDDSRLAMLSSNTHVTGQTYTNPNGTNTMTGENMPGSDVFQVAVSSTDPNINGPVNFWIGAVAMQISTSTAEFLGTKGVFVAGAEITTAAPEPASVPLILGAILIFASVYIRRCRMTK